MGFNFHFICFFTAVSDVKMVCQQNLYQPHNSKKDKNADEFPGVSVVCGVLENSVSHVLSQSDEAVRGLV